MSRSNVTTTIDIAIPAFNVAHCIDQTLDAIFAQDLPPGVSVRVCIANDASTDDLHQRVHGRNDSRLAYAAHDTNRGRSAACNTAAALGDGEFIVVLDADCRFADRRVLARMLSHFSDGADAVLGTVAAAGSGFWAKYARLVSARRLNAAMRDGPWHMTTANFAVRRSVFDALGGFSTIYRYYGFEDRDFLIRLSRPGTRILIDRYIVVLHREPTAVLEVCKKLYESGRYTAAEFAARFPDEYRRSAYRRFDMSRHRWLSRALAPLLKVLCPLSQATSQSLIRRTTANFALQVWSLRVASALSYLQGTCDAAIAQSELPTGKPTR